MPETGFPLARETNRLAAVSMASVKRLLTRIGLWLAATLVLALVSGAVAQWALSQHTLSNAVAPGKLVDVGGHRLHLVCEGAGSPAVILEAGLPGSSLTWTSVNGSIAEFAKVCAYDRAGYAWSEAALPARTAGNIVRELRLLLQNAAIDPPFVLVGHSFGGLIVQLYAARFVDEVAGMVLVDSSHPAQLSQTKSLETANAFGRTVGFLAPTGVPRLLFPVPAGSPESRDESVLALENRVMKTTRSLRTVATEVAGLRESLREAAAEPADLGRRPLIVLTEGRRRAGFWYEMQEELTGLSETGDWQIADNAGHYIQHDRPELVVEAIRRVVEQVRSENRSGALEEHRH